MRPWAAPSCIEEFLDFYGSFVHGVFEAVVHDYGVESVGVAVFLFCLGYALFNRFRAVRPSRKEPAAQFFHRRGHDEYCKRVLPENAFQIHASLYIDVEDNRFALRPDTFELRFQGAVVGTRINLFIFYESFFGNHFSESFGREKIIFLPVSFVSPRGARCRGYRKFELGEFFKHFSDNRAFSGTGRGREYDYFSVIHFPVCKFLQK